MKKHTISLQLIQRFLSEDELKMILEEFNHVETARKCTSFRTNINMCALLTLFSNRAI